MIREATINGKNIWQEWGAELADGALEQLLSPPPAKEYISCESRSEDGVRIVVEKAGIQFDTREVSLTVLITGKTQDDYLRKYMSFVEELKKGKLAVGIPWLGKVYTLYYLSVSKYGSFGCNRGKFTVKLREGNPAV